MSKLYVVPTPIGNLEDITIRAINVLKEVDFVLAEDTRTTKKLFQKYEIENSLLSHHIHNEHKTLESIVGKIKLGQTAAVVSDAGTPAISDPGFLLVRECIANAIEVVCLPGPSAVLPAIVGSGFPCDRFIFEGFLPHKKGRQTRWKIIAEEERAVILYESPHRLVKALKEIVEFIGATHQICVAREISKIHEEFKRGTAQEVLNYYEEKKPKGEIVIVIDAKK
jgi:16S rRNA (cytidine1402-2'-O)-methyltransferase